MTQREAMKELLFLIDTQDYRGRDQHELKASAIVQRARAILAKNDELTLEEVRLLLIKDDERAGFHQEVVIRANSFVLEKIVDGQQLYEDLVIPPHNADGSIPENGHKDIPEGQAPSMDGLRTMLDR